MKRVVFIKNAVVLTATALVLRLAGIVFKVWLAAHVGSEGIGLYQLVLSFYVLISAFASGGICTAVTRLCAEELANGSALGAGRVLKKGIVLSLLLSAVSLAFTFLSADFLAGTLLGDMRAAPALRVLGFSLPFMAINSCVRGYFFARRKTVSPAISQMLEQAVRILLVVLLAGSFAKRGIGFASAAVMLGDTVAEGISCIFMGLVLRYDLKRLKNTAKQSGKNGYRKILGISLPITAGRYLNSLLRTAENVIVPRCLAVATSAASSLSQFGMIKGMALPLLFFPSSFLSSVSTLLIPEMSEAQALHKDYKIRYAAEKVIKLTSVSAFLLAALFFVLSEPLALAVYRERAVGFLLRALAPIVPLMYLDSVCDGMLKGLDRQRFVFWVAVSDSAARLALIPLLVPKMGMTGFLLIMTLSNIYTAALRVGMLIKISKMPFSVGQYVTKPLLSAAFAVSAAFLLLSRLPLGNVAFICSVVAVSTTIYAVLVFFFGLVDRDDLRGVFQ